LIFSRITQGRERARQNGIRFGRKPKLTAYQRQEALEWLGAGEIQSTIARSFNVDRATISPRGTAVTGAPKVGRESSHQLFFDGAG
jgi:DNA invertase Pin-like site-specific DNA recombinase